MTRLLQCLIALSALASTVPAQDPTAARIDEIFQPWNKAGSPGATVAVIHDGRVVFQKGYGLANLEYDIANKPETIFHVASVSKQFTAMAIVLLEQDGKLSIEDDIHKYLPELPDYGHKIAIRNLLQHTSGIRDQWQTLALAGWRLDDVITQKQINRMLFRQKELNFVPGTQYLYSNGGFSLAAEIVARVSGKPLPQFCEERIFQPLGMSRTHFHDDHRRIVHDRAYSYETTPAGFESAPLNYANVGATSLFTTAPDLAKWLDNFREPKVGGKAAIARLEEEGVLVDGHKTGYALGLLVGKHRGLATISHNGADAGYRSAVVWFPDQQTGVVVLSNLGNVDPSGLANKVAAVYLEDKMTAAVEQKRPEPRTYVTVDPASLAQFAGNYDLGQNVVLAITVQNGKLYGAPAGQQPLELRPVGPTKFYAEQSGSEVEFSSLPGGGMHLKLVRRAGAPIEGSRSVSATVDTKELRQYTGVYWSDELETQYTVVEKDGKLRAEHIRHGEIEFTPVRTDQFSTRSWFMSDVKFRRGADGKVNGMIVGGGRVTGIQFAKK